MPSYVRYVPLPGLPSLARNCGQLPRTLRQARSSQFHGFRIARPIRRRNDDFVAIIEQDLKGFVYGLLAAIGHDHLIRIDSIPRVAQRFVCDRLAQFRQTCRRSVTIVLRILHRFGRSRDDRSRSRKVRFARTKSNDVDSFSFHRFRFGINGRVALGATRLIRSERVCQSAIVMFAMLSLPPEKQQPFSTFWNSFSLLTGRGGILLFTGHRTKEGKGLNQDEVVAVD